MPVHVGGIISDKYHDIRITVGFDKSNSTNTNMFKNACLQS